MFLKSLGIAFRRETEIPYTPVDGEVIEEVMIGMMIIIRITLRFIIVILNRLLLRKV